MAISANTVTARKSKGLSDESIKPPWTSDNSLNLVIGGIDNAKTLVKFDGVCLKQDKVTFTPKAALNFYIIYEVNLWPLNLDSKFAYLNSLFSAVKFTKNADLDKYSYSGYGIIFGTRGTFSLSEGSEFGKNVIIFGTDMKLFVHISNTKKDILILGKGPTNRLDDNTVTAEA